MASALGAALGGKSMVDMDALNELLDTATVEELDDDENQKLHRVVFDALDKRDRLQNRRPPPPPPRVKTAAERKWHLQAYRDVCARHLAAVEDVFSEAVAEQLAAHTDVLANVAAQVSMQHRDPNSAERRANAWTAELGNAVEVSGKWKPSLLPASCETIMPATVLSFSLSHI